MLQPVSFGREYLSHILHPFCIQSRFIVIRGNFCESSDRTFVSTDVFTRFGLRNSKLQGFRGKVCRASAYEV